MMTNLGFLYHNFISAKEGGRFVSSTSTKDGVGSLSSSDGSLVKGLGNVYYDTMNKTEGNASLHINRINRKLVDGDYR